MSIPLRSTTPTTQNHRVAGYEVSNEDTPKVYQLRSGSGEDEVTEIIWAAYRQVFGEHLILESYRQIALESQLRNRSISVRDFVRGLAKSLVYWELVGETNSNYRLVDITFKRLLGRASYGREEQISWSIVIATQGLHGFVDAVIDSDEYRQNFGDAIVPYQRRRFGDRPFNLATPRYGDDWRSRELLRHLEGRSFYQVRRYQAGELDRQVVRNALPPQFLAMAQRTLTDERNYQRTIASVTSRVQDMTIPDTSHTAPQGQRQVKTTPVSLPYRYLPSALTVTPDR